MNDNGTITICMYSFVTSISYSCSGDDLVNPVHLNEGCVTIPCCNDEFVSIFFTVTLPDGETHYCSHVLQIIGCVQPCLGIDSDGDGICDPDDCWPDDANQSYGPGDPCDDGDPNTIDDTYNAYCQCIGAEMVECVGIDSDSDGVCDSDDCWPNDPSQTQGPGDSCDDGNPMTINDSFDTNCNCLGEEILCGDIILDDGCDLTEDIIDENCNVLHIPPDTDDGCAMTLDYFDPVNCAIINVCIKSVGH